MDTKKRKHIQPMKWIVVHGIDLIQEKSDTITKYDEMTRAEFLFGFFFLSPIFLFI